jgi:hypothetical protein
MSNKYERISIKPIMTGFLVSIEQHYYDGDSYAFATWEEVLAFLKDKTPVFLPPDTKNESATEAAVADLAS